MAKVTLHATIFGEDGIKTRDYETALIPDAKNQEMQVINLYPDKTYQKIEGFGAALTESAGYALSRMSEENRKKIVEAYYGKDGIGYTIGRIHMDSCDFSIGNYCAVENPDDPEFRDFSLERDAKYVQLRTCSTYYSKYWTTVVLQIVKAGQWISKTPSSF